MAVRLPSFIVKNYEKRLMLSSTLKRKLDAQRLLVAFHLNDPSLAQANHFRRIMQGTHPKADYRHVRNNLTKVVINNTKFAPLAPLLESVTGMAMSPDPVGGAQTVMEWQKANPNFVVIGGVMDGMALNKNDIKTLSELPAKEDELKAHLGGLVHSQLMSPAASLISVLTAHQIQTLAVLSAKPKTDTAAAAAAGATATPAAPAK